MSDNEEIGDKDNWDFERAERRSSTRRPRAVVSVAFSRNDFEHIAEAAEAFEMKVSEFIRTAALAAAGRQTLFHFGAELTVSQARWSYVSPDEEQQPKTASEGRHPLERIIA